MTNVGWTSSCFAVGAEDRVDQLALAHRLVGLDVQLGAGFAQLLVRFCP